MDEIFKQANVLEYEAPGPISKTRQRVWLILLILSILMMVAGIGLGAAGVMSVIIRKRASVPVGMEWLVTMIYMAGGVGWGILYLACGLKIKRGGYVSVIIALVAASLQELLVLLILAGYAVLFIAMRHIMMSSSTVIWVLSVVILLWLLLGGVLGRLIFDLVRVLREPRIKDSHNIQEAV